MPKHPCHIAFIMDGNNRYSKKNNISNFHSYKKGAEKILKISSYIFKNYQTNTISAFALSSSNLKRPKKILNTILEVLNYFLDQKLNNLNFKIDFRGDLTFLSPQVNSKIKKLRDLQSQNNKKLIIYINYSGKLDIINAAKSFKNERFDSDKFKNKLLSQDTPDPDILIRTGGFQRISDFFLYQISFTELFFLRKLWPELSNSDIKKIILSFQKVERKFGI